MAILLIGIICFLAAARALRAGEARHAPLRPGIWAAAIALVTLFELWTARADIARYRFSMVGLRYGEVPARAANADPLTIRIGGGDDADLDLRAAGAAEVLRIEAAGAVDTAAPYVDAHLIDDATAVAIVERRDRLRRRHRSVLGARVVTASDTIAVQTGTGVARLVVERVPDTVSVGRIAVPLPWTDRHRVRDVASGRSVMLPLSQLGWARRLTGRRPSVFARAFPLADVADSITPDAGPRLTSFFFYDGPDLMLADLDSEVTDARSGEQAGASTALWLDGRSSRLMLAALPLRDYPELRLALPERYGVRPVAAYDVALNGSFIDLRFAEPEIRALDRDQLEASRLPSGPGETDLLRVRVSHTANSLVRRAVVFESPPRSFAPGTEAILALPLNPAEREFEVVTPAGATRWPTAVPIPLGTGRRATLLRVDGQAASAGFWLLYIALFGMVVAVFALRRPLGATGAIAFAALGMVTIRLLLGVSAHLAPPFVEEAAQLGLWLLPVLPWAVIAASDAGRAWTGTLGPEERRSILALHAATAAVLVVLGLAIFHGSIVRQVVLGAVPLAFASAVALGMRADVASRAFSRMRERSGSARDAGSTHRESERADPPMPDSRRGWVSKFRRLGAIVRNGWALGLLLLLSRIVLDLAGWREGISVGGTRIAMSLLYTPVSLLALAWLLTRWLRELGAGDEQLQRARFARGFLDIAAFLVLAFLGVGFTISDFGIPLALAPGALVALALIGMWLAGRPLPGKRAAVALAIPLVLFIAVQAAPRMLEPAWSGPSGEAGRMSEWNRNELLLLERGDPQALQLIGQRRSEALAVMRETMRSYTRRNWLGKGFLQGRVSSAIEETATREHTASALLASQWGLAGTIGLVLLLCVLFRPAAPALAGGETGRYQHAATRTVAGLTLGVLCALVIIGRVMPAPYGAVLVLLGAAAAMLPALAPTSLFNRRTDERDAHDARPTELPSPTPATEGQAMHVRFPDVAAALFLLTFACAGLYMVLANYGLVFFTGKNVYLLGLDSVGDALEALVLLAGAAGLFALRAPPVDEARERDESPHREVVVRVRDAGPVVEAVR